jgi:hypothetical protein
LDPSLTNGVLKNDCGPGACREHWARAARLQPDEPKAGFLLEMKGGRQG